MNTTVPPNEYVHLDTQLALSQIGDVEAMNGMLAMLEETLSRDVPLVADLLDQGDIVGANRILHPLKGFIPIFCRAPLCEMVAQVEALSKDAHSTSVGPAYADLMPELNLLLDEVDAYLNGGSADH